MIKNTFFLLIATCALSACDPVTQLFTSTNDTQPADNATAPVTTVSETPKIVAWMTLGEETESTDKRLLSGQVSAAESTHLAFEIGGQIKTIAVKLGDQFSAGQTLATLKDSDYRLQLQQAKAQYTAAIAARDQARTDMQRHQRLVKSGAVSKAQADAYRLQLKSAQETVNTADAQLKLAQNQLNHTDLVAPFTGVVTAQLGEIGQLADPTVPIFTVEAIQAPEVRTAVPENLIDNIKPNQTVSVTFPARPTIAALSGRVTEISTQATLGAFPAIITLENAPKSIKPGMTAEIELPQPMTAGGFSIPPGALAAGQGNNHFVYRIVGDSDDLTLESVPVTVQGLTGKHLRIDGDLQAGDKIVRSGWSFLSEQQSVQLMHVGARTVNP